MFGIISNRSAMSNTTFKSMLWTFCLSLLSVFHGWAVLNPDRYNFSYLTADDGMAQNTVDYIYQDSRGMMWFATWNGLNSFDGYRFTRYHTQPGDDALNSLFVRTLAEDTSLHLWIGTEEGVQMLDLSSGHMVRPSQAAIASHPVFSAQINALLCDREGRMWIGSAEGLALVSMDREGVIRSIDWLRKGMDASVSSLCQAPDGTVWVGYQSGEIQSVGRLSEKAFRFEAAPEVLAAKPYGEIFAICADGEELWFGTARGLARYHTRTGAYRFYVNRPDDPRSLIQDYVKDIVCDREGNIIVATYKGLCIYNKETDDFLQITSEAETIGGLNNNFVNSLYVEPCGTIWIGTEKGGINKMIKKQVMFELYRHNPKQPASLSPNPVNAIFEDSRRTLWIGTVEGGLNKRSNRKNTFEHYRADDSYPYSLTHNTVSFITEGDGMLWIATWGGGINRMALSQEGHFTVVSEEIRNGAFSSEFISWLVYDKELNGLWVATVAGLDFYDLAGQAVLPILNASEAGDCITAVSGLCLDTRRRLWVGTERGLFCIDLKRSEMKGGRMAIQRCRLTPPGSRTPRNEKVNCIYEAADHTIWLGTYGNGLYKLEEANDDPGHETYRFVNYGTESGLSDNVIYGICEDCRGTLWLSTNRGLSCFYPEKELAATFYTSDGLPNNQFYWTAACRTAEGTIWFGNVEGAVSFNPEVVRPDTSPLAVTIVGGFVYNDPVHPPSFPEVWKLKEQDKSFSLDFSALYYVAPEKIRYAYRLKGFDTDWREVEANRRFASYTNLSAGKYVFQVKCTNPDGEWSDRITELNIRVIPPFYKERWFLFTLVAVVFISLYYINEMRIRNLRRQKEHLERTVEERTEKIETQKNTLISQAKDLEDTLHKLIAHQEEISHQNEQLIAQNNEISRQKEQLEELSAQLHRATQDKINFFTNITHEFKTPLTLILGPIEQALQWSRNPKVQEQLALVRKNSKYLLSLVNQLMDFRKADAGNMKVKKTPGDFREFVHAIVLPFYSLAKARRVELDERYRLPRQPFRFDSDLLQKVLVNLLSNAVKFTPDGGAIRLVAALLPRENGKSEDRKDKEVPPARSIYISVNDTGAGIPEESLPFVFDRFYQVDNQKSYPVCGQSGTGIGLYLCRQIIDVLGGRIWVKNNRKGGVSFRVLLPLEAEDWETAEDPGLYVSPELYSRGQEETDEDGKIDRSKPLLLIVEDNPDMRTFIRSILDEKFHIVEACDGEAGLAKALKFGPDFIISDIMMPVMDGLEFTRKVKNNFATSHIPVLLLTAKNATDVRIEGYNSGADGYIAKPFDAALLTARIHNMIEGRSRLHEAFKHSLDIHSLPMEEVSQDRVFLNKLMDTIRENYTNSDFDVADLIDKMHLSKSLLHKKLQSLVGQPAVQVIRTFRLNKSKELMENTRGRQMNISEIAYAVGFNDPKYFTRCFTKHFGITPSAFGDSLPDTDR